MEGGIPGRDPGRDPDSLRVSDDDRHRVAEILRRAAGDGRIDLGELDDRLGVVFQAKTYAELEPVTRDLPEHPGRLAPVPRPAAFSPDAPMEPERHAAILSGFDRKGVWTAPPALTVTAFMGGVDLDFRQAVFSAPECVVTVNAFMGGASITVGPDVRVVMEGTAIMGGYSGPDGGEELHPDSPTVRIRGVAVMGGVDVNRRGPKRLG